GGHRDRRAFPTRRSSDLGGGPGVGRQLVGGAAFDLLLPSGTTAPLEVDDHGRLADEQIDLTGHSQPVELALERLLDLAHAQTMRSESTRLNSSHVKNSSA